MNYPFIPRKAYFEPETLNYPLGQDIYHKLAQLGIDITMTGSHNRITGITGINPQDTYRQAKETLVVGVRRSRDFTVCKPSAHYQLPLNTSCPSMCEYCYLMTTLGKKPYLRIYVNIDEILATAAEYISARIPEITIFEGAATSDPIPTEHLSGLLKKTINFFGTQTYGRFRFVTKHTHVDSLLSAQHNGHTRFRFSLNAASIIKRYEHKTPPMEARILAAGKVAKADYPLGFIIAPIFYFSGWEQEYTALFKLLSKAIPETLQRELTFELITHRYTNRAKSNIQSIFPTTTLPMENIGRKFKYGQFGYGKFLYLPEQMRDMQDFMRNIISQYFPQAHVDYFV